MNGITVQTALEIYTQPKDLYICVGKPQEEKKFAFTISRGPGHNYKQLVSSSASFETVESAIKEVKSLLKDCCQAAKKIISDPNNVLTIIFNPDNRPVLEDRILNDAFLEQIMLELEKNNEVDTCEYVLVK